jgi:hypothetical protein
MLILNVIKQTVYPNPYGLAISKSVLTLALSYHLDSWTHVRVCEDRGYLTENLEKTLYESRAGWAIKLVCVQCARVPRPYIGRVKNHRKVFSQSDWSKVRKKIEFNNKFDVANGVYTSLYWLNFWSDWSKVRKKSNLTINSPQLRLVGAHKLQIWEPRELWKWILGLDD